MFNKFKISSIALLLVFLMIFSCGCNVIDSNDLSNNEGVSETEDISSETLSDNMINPEETEDGSTSSIIVISKNAEELRSEFYGNSDPADSYEEAIERSQRGEISGALKVPYQAPTISSFQPQSDGKYIRNNEPYYIDENTYVVVDAMGREIFRVYRGGGYITLEEVAAYVYAFGDVPANYVTGKSSKPASSIWGEYLRLNHSKFTGNTSKYPYEPELPRISGCGGDLVYYEIDIGTTGTDCDPHYKSKIYNDGTHITRGAARIVYTRFDANGDNIIDPNEKFLFYTYNHYNDFQEYLNYFAGWGEMFGNITGGGELSSRSDYNPTPYVPVFMGSLKTESAVNIQVDYYFVAILPLDLYYPKKTA